MSPFFTETTRSVQADDFKFMLIILIIVMAVLLGWLTWFNFGTVSVYEVSETLELLDSQTIMAKFVKPSGSRIQRGQQAWIYFNGELGEQVNPVSVVVIHRKEYQDQFHVKLFIKTRFNPPLEMNEKTTGRVDVEVEYISPASMVVRAINQNLNKPQRQIIK